MLESSAHTVLIELGLRPDAARALLTALGEVVRAEAYAGRMQEREWLTVADVAKRIRFSEHKVNQLRRSGVLPMFQAPNSNAWRITPAAFDKWEARVSAEGLPMEARYPARRAR
ncbi:MAG TPA: helix-turn-helix domain-containing protein [Rubricoccaceae bacterium]|jgi:DNA polymerase III alpha subunit (gram-positive type)